MPGPLPLLRVREGTREARGAVPHAGGGRLDRTDRRRGRLREALFTLGDRPEDRYAVARDWLDERGFDSTLDYLRAVAIRVIEETACCPTSTRAS